MAIEKRQQQGADMGPVDIGVGHDDDLVVADLFDIEIFASDAGAERRYQSADFRRRQHLVKPRAFDIEDLAPQRQHRLIQTVACLFRRAPRRVTLDDKKLALFRIALLTIGELAGQAGDVERALAPCQIARLAGGFARRRRLDHLADDGPRLGRMLLEPLPETVADDALDHRAHLGAHQLVFGLRGKLRIGNLDRQHAGQPFAHIVAGELDFFSFLDPAGGRIGVDRPRQRTTETR